MVILKLKSFARWARSKNLTDQQLKVALDEIERGLIDADLGSGLIKKRMPGKSQGKRGGYRVFLAFKQKERVIFLFGFSKNEQNNIEDNQLLVLKELSKEYLGLTDIDIFRLIEQGYLIKVN